MEFENFGLNAATISFLGILFLAIWRFWSVWRQKAAIWRGKTGKSVSVPRFAYNTCFSFTNLVYGITANSFALIATGSVFIVDVQILYGLKKFKGFTRRENIAVGAIALAAGVILLVPENLFRTYYFVFVLFGFSVSFHQIWEIWQNKSSGEVDPHLLITNIVTSVFWTVYAFAIREWPIMILSPLFLITNSVSLFFWKKYKVAQQVCRKL